MQTSVPPAPPVPPLALSPAQPSLHSALYVPNIANELYSSWMKTQRDDLEYGGWIYCERYKPAPQSPEMIRYAIRQAPTGSRNSIILTNIADLAKVYGDTKYNGKITILADFHCHPGAQYGACHPSAEDINNAAGITYDRLVITNDTLPTEGSYPNGLLMYASPLPVPWSAPTGILWLVKKRRTPLGGLTRELLGRRDLADRSIY